MAKLHLHHSKLNIRVEDESFGRDGAGIEISSGLDGYPIDGDYSKLQGGGYPVLSVDISGEETTGRASFEIVGFKEIDALRRYCEMTLELYKEGRLE